MPTLVLIILLGVAGALVLSGLALWSVPLAMVVAGLVLGGVVLFVDFSRPEDGESS